MGVDQVVIDRVTADDSGLIHVYGSNFTDFSVIALDGEILDTVRKAPGELIAPEPVPLTDPGQFDDGGKIVTVRQVTADGLTLSESVGRVIREALPLEKSE